MIYSWGNDAQRNTGYGPCLNRDDRVAAIDDQSGEDDLFPDIAAGAQSDDGEEPDFPKARMCPSKLQNAENTNASDHVRDAKDVRLG